MSSRVISKLALSLGMASILVAAPVLAQEKDPNAGAESDATEAGATTGEGGTAGAAPSDLAAIKDEKDDGAPFKRIADDEETIYAVQRKAYLVNRKIELTPMLAVSFTDRFVQTFAPAASVTYHLAENFGIEAFGAFMFPDEAALTIEILEPPQRLTPEVAKLTQMLWAAGLGAQWSPIYGKVQIFGASLGNFNFYIGAGLGVGQTRVQCTPRQQLDPNEFGANAECQSISAAGTSTTDDPLIVYEPARMQLMGAFSGGLRFYFSDSIGLKLEVKDYVYSTRVYRPMSQEATQRFTDAVRNNIFAQIGVSFLFGGEE